MRIRNDVHRGRSEPPEPVVGDAEGIFAQDVDRVLIACRECGRNHLAALACPPKSAPMRSVLQSDGSRIIVVDEPEWGLVAKAA